MSLIPPAVAVVAAIVVMSSATRARADPVRLSVESSGGCPDEENFTARVRARTTFETAAPDEPALTFKVRLLEEADRAMARLEVRTFDGIGRERGISAATCEEVATAMAFVVAVAIDRSGLMDEDESAEPGPPTESAEPAPAPAKVETRPIPASQRQDPPVVDRPVSVRRSDSSESPKVSAGVSAMFVGGVAPWILVVPSPFVELHAFTKELPDPAIRVSLIRTMSGAIDSPLGSAELTWTVGRLDLCPFRLPLTQWSGLRSCALVDAGVLEGAGLDVSEPNTQSRPWLAPGADARLDFALFGTLLFEVTGGLAFPLIRDEFAIGPGAPLHEVPSVAGTVSAGVGVELL